jgi:hypothetical protein
VLHGFHDSSPRLVLKRITQTRLVLIDKKNEIRADTAALSLESREWAEIAAHGEHDHRDLAIRTARFLDERCGKTCRCYSFTPFAMDGSEGYFVFDCNVDRAPLAIFESEALDATTAVMTACFYIGYVRCHR